MRIGSLFSGVGGLELGLEHAGLGPVVFQVEKEPFCREVLARHWPTVPRFDDVRTVGAHNLPACDLLCGGFPCQDLSLAGKGAGLDGERSGLWWEYARIIGELRPGYVVVENVSALVNRGLARVLGTLATLGYDAWWDCLPASAVGAPHQRDRLFLLAWRVADAERGGRDRLHERDESGPLAPNAEHGGQDGLAHPAGGVRQRTPQGTAAGHAALSREGLADADGHGELEPQRGVSGERGRALDVGEDVGHALGSRLPQRQGQPRDDGAEQPAAQRAGGQLAHADRERGLQPGDAQGRRRARGGPGQHDAGRLRAPSGAGGLESGVGDSAHGTPRWMDGHWPARPGEDPHPWEAPRTAILKRWQRRPARLKALGNAVVPAVGYVVGCLVQDLAAARGGARRAGAPPTKGTHE